MAPPSLSAFLEQNLPGEARAELRTSVLPTLLQAVADIGTSLRASLSVQAVGSTNTSGDAQLNVDLATNVIVHNAIRTCPSIVSASSEEDEGGETKVQHDPGVRGAADGQRSETYSVGFDPLDGSSIIGANWSVGTIIGVWDGPTALGVRAREKLVASVMGVLGPRTSAIVAVRLPESPERELCFEVGLSSSSFSSSVPGDEDGKIRVVRERVRFAQSHDVKTRYFAPANLRAASHFPAYSDLVSHFISQQYTLRYSGGLVPDIYHSLVKGHGVYISPVTEKSKAKLRVLYEVAPIALVVECAGGSAVDPESGDSILERSVGEVDDRVGVVCGTREEVEMVVGKLRAT